MAVTVADDRQWLALAELLGDAAIGEQYATLDARLANHDELDDAHRRVDARRARRPRQRRRCRPPASPPTRC